MARPPIDQLLTDKLQAHQQSQFTGFVHISISQTPQWSLYFYTGRLVWAHSRLHPIRRWHRQLLKHCEYLVAEATHSPEFDYSQLRYKVLTQKVQQGSLSRVSIAKAVEDYLSEILFDIVHQGTLRHLQSKPPFTLIDVRQRLTSSLFVMVRSQQAWQNALRDWQVWQQAELLPYSPNLAPIIAQPDALKQSTSEAVYRHLVSIAGVQQTLRDIAIAFEQPLLLLTQRIVPYVRQGVIELASVSDLCAKAQTITPTTRKPLSQMFRSPSQAVVGKDSSESPAPDCSASPHLVICLDDNNSSTDEKYNDESLAPAHSTSSPLIIYIDDRPTDRKVIGDILADAGFRFQGISASSQMLPFLIEHKPQLIFLKLVMAKSSGYEICSRIRRVSLFQDIPIVVVSPSDTLADRVRAKVVGASGFIKQPIQRSIILKVVHKLLNETSTVADASRTIVTNSVVTRMTKAQTARTAQTLQQQQQQHREPLSTSYSFGDRFPDN